MLKRAVAVVLVVVDVEGSACNNLLDVGWSASVSNVVGRRALTVKKLIPAFFIERTFSCSQSNRDYDMVVDNPRKTIQVALR
jgi:hypothetical protein